MSISKAKRLSTVVHSKLWLKCTFGLVVWHHHQDCNRWDIGTHLSDYTVSKSRQWTGHCSGTSYLGGLGFKSRSEYWLSWQFFFCSFLKFF